MEDSNQIVDTSGPQVYEPNPINEIEGWDTDHSATTNTAAPVEAPPLALWTVLTAFVLTAGPLFAFYWLRSPHGVSASPWLAALYTGAPRGGMAAITIWCAALPFKTLFADTLVWFDTLNVTLASAAAGTLAAGIAGRCARFIRRPEAAVLGIVGGLLAGLSPLWLRIATAPGPDSLTLLLAVASLSVLLMLGEPQRWWQLGMCGFLAGCAAANHPSFAWLLLPILIYAISRESAVGRLGLIMLAVVLGFALGLSTYLATQLTRGIPAELALLQWSQAPVPLLWGGALDLSATLTLIDQLPKGALLLALAGLAAAVDHRIRPYALVAVGGLLIMGPLYPFMTNAPQQGYFPASYAAPLMAVAMTALLIGLGSAFLVARFTARLSRWVTLGFVVLAAVALVGAQGQAPIDRRGNGAETLGEAILRDCPGNALVVVGSPRLASLLIASQQARQIRSDVSVFSLDSPLDSLTRNHQTHLAQNTGPSKPTLTLAQNAAPPPALPTSELPDPILWRVIQRYYPDRPVCFLAVESPWLVHRAQIVGGVLQYPRGELEEATALKDALDAVITPESAKADPDLAEAIGEVLTPLSTAARLQADPTMALEYAQFAAALAPDTAAPHRLMARAATRLGEEDEALRHAEACLRRMNTAQNAADFLADLKSDDQLRQREIEFRSVWNAALGDPNRAGADATRAITNDLWQAGEFAILARGYAILGALNLNDMDIAYECAAAYAQLGDVDRARDALGRAMRLDPATVQDRLKTDDRFLPLTLAPLAPANTKTT